MLHKELQKRMEKCFLYRWCNFVHTVTLNSVLNSNIMLIYEQKVLYSFVALISTRFQPSSDPHCEAFLAGMYYIVCIIYQKQPEVKATKAGKIQKKIYICLYAWVWSTSCYQEAYLDIHFKSAFQMYKRFTCCHSSNTQELNSDKDTKLSAWFYQKNINIMDSINQSACKQ